MNTDPPDPSVETLRDQVRARRRAFARSSDSRFVRTMQTVIDDYLQARAQGVSREDAVKGLETVLRAAWPKGVSRFVPQCGRCDDRGWRLLECHHAARCGRRVCSDREDTYTHAMVTPCDCPKGDPFKPTRSTPEEAIAKVGRTKKRTGFSLVGRP